jgi:acetyltransferase-like isoleucine patch superfamily enzyme
MNTGHINKRLTNDKFIFVLRRFLLKIIYKNKIEFGENLRVLGALPFCKLPKNGKLILGKNVVLNSDFKNSATALTTKVKFVTGYDGKIVVGDNCDFNGTCIVAYDEIEIGNHCQIASSSLISDNDFHPVDPEWRLKQMIGDFYPFSAIGKKKITIGNNVWIGWGAVILKGVTIGDNSIIAAGSIVTSDIPANCIAAGNPAKVVKNI